MSLHSLSPEIIFPPLTDQEKRAIVNFLKVNAHLHPIFISRSRGILYKNGYFPEITELKPFGNNYGGWSDIQHENRFKHIEFDWNMVTIIP